MKKLLWGLIFLFGCGRNYKTIASDYIKSKIRYPESLMIVQILSPDSVKTSYYETAEFRKYKFSVDSLMNEYQKQVNQSISKSIADNTYKNATQMSLLIKTRAKSFKGELKGWRLRVVYNAKNASGLYYQSVASLLLANDRKTIKDGYGF